MKRLLVVSFAALMAAGCSDLTSASLPNTTTASLQPPSGAAGPIPSAISPSAPSDIDQVRNAQRTMGSKVLSAIALERVTGRKADPGRLAETNPL